MATVKVYFSEDFGYYMPVPPAFLDAIETFTTKKKALDVAKANTIPIKYVQKVGSRFWSCWGIMAGENEFIGKLS